MVGYHHEAINGRELTTTEHSEAGLASGIATRLIIQPLDVLKIRFQLQEEPIRGKTSGKYKGVWQSTQLIFREEGAGALWKGHIPAQGLSAMYGLVQFSSFETLSSIVGDRLPASSSDFLCGSLAGCFAMTCAMPLDVIRTRLVAQGNQGVVYRGTLHAIKYIWKREGFPGYFRGWVPSVIQIAPFTGLQFAFFNMFQEFWNKVIPSHETVGVLIAGASAGTVAKTILYPLDMVRHRLQMNGFERKGFGKASRYQNGMVQAMAHVVKNESAYGLFKGLWPSQIKAAANSGCTIVSGHSICFTIGKLLFGIASDRYSPVNLLILGLSVVSFAGIALAYADTFIAVNVAFLIIGLLQGAAWTPATRLVSNWYDGSSFGKMFSLLGCGSTIAGLLTTYLNEFYWRDLGFYMGGYSLTFCIIALFVLRADNVPPQLYKGKEKNSSAAWNIVSSSVIWGVALSYIFTLEVRTVCETWLPLYVDVQGLSSSKFLVVYEISGFAGSLLSGIILDELSFYVPQETARKLVAVFSSLSMLFSYMISTSFPGYYLLIAFSCGFFTNASINIWCLISSVAGQKHIAGSCSAFISFVANFGPIIAGAPLAHLISLYGYSIFLPFFASQIAVFLCITLLKIPLQMPQKLKDN